MITQIHEVTDALRLQAVLLQSAEAREIGYGAQCEHELVVLEHDLLPLVAAHQGDAPAVQIDFLDVVGVDADTG